MVLEPKVFSRFNVLDLELLWSNCRGFCIKNYPINSILTNNKNYFHKIKFMNPLKLLTTKKERKKKNEECGGVSWLIYFIFYLNFRKNINSFVCHHVFSWNLGSWIKHEDSVSCGLIRKAIKCILVSGEEWEMKGERTLFWNFIESIFKLNSFNGRIQMNFPPKTYWKRIKTAKSSLPLNWVPQTDKHQYHLCKLRVKWSNQKNTQTFVN